MNPSSPFQPEDLAELDERLLDRALAIWPMRRINDAAMLKASGPPSAEVIGMRHDVDNAIEPAVAFARWEASRGYASTYFILHTAPYWDDKPLLRRSIDEISSLGHEIGIHNNAIAASLLTGDDPLDVLDDAVEELRGYGVDVSGTVAHGDGLCYRNGHVWFVNDEIFAECSRPDIGAQGREIGGYQTARASLADFGLDYEANWIGAREYLSDSGGQWREPGFETIAAGFPLDLQLQVLIHPDWWDEAFVEVHA